MNKGTVSLRDHAHHVLRTYVSEHPRLYLPFARRKYPGPSPNVIGPDTELVIDGYTRCATTFAVYAFQFAQPNPVRLAHHLHAPAQLIRGAKAGLPTLVLIREPEEAVLSQVTREPRVSLQDGLWSYARFYTSLMRLRSSFVVADFDHVTTDFGAVTRRINDRFGTSYSEFHHSGEDVRACVDLIRHRPTLSPALLGFESGVVSLTAAREELRRVETTPVDAEDAWIPSEERARSKEALRSRLFGPELEARRMRARLIYERFRTGA